jgi:hypothetical protein
MRGSIEASGRSPVKFRAALAVLAICAISGTTFPGSTTAASRLPTTKVLVNVRCSADCTHLVGVYKVRPRRIYVSEGLGGSLTLDWSQWHTTWATGTGTSYAVLPGGDITAHVSVSLGEWVQAMFLAMRIHFTHVRIHDPKTGAVRSIRSHYEQLIETFAEDGQPAWVTPGQAAESETQRLAIRAPVEQPSALLSVKPGDSSGT